MDKLTSVIFVHKALHWAFYHLWSRTNLNHINYQNNLNLHQCFPDSIPMQLVYMLVKFPAQRGLHKLNIMSRCRMMTMSVQPACGNIVNVWIDQLYVFINVFMILAQCSWSTLATSPEHRMVHTWNILSWLWGGCIFCPCFLWQLHHDCELWWRP